MTLSGFKWRRIWLLLTALLVYFVVDTLYDAGVFKTVVSKFDGTQIRIFHNMPGPEDMALDRESKLLFISSSDRWAQRSGQKASDGIFLLNIDSDQLPRRLPNTYNGDFHPHGISIYKKDSLLYLFVVNHNESGDYVEIFNYENDSLQHLQSISDELMCCPNDVVAIDFNRFYVTNDHKYKRGLMRKLEDYLRLPKSALLYYDGEVMKIVYSGLNYANGVNISNNGKQLYLTHTTGGELLIFNRTNNPESIELAHKIDLNTGPDNIDVDENDHLWIAAHPKLFDFVAHAADSSKISPSQIIRIKPDFRGNYEVNEMLMDDGKKLSGSSVAVHFKGELFVGVVFESKLFHGKLQ